MSGRLGKFIYYYSSYNKVLQEARLFCGREGLQELHLFSPFFFLTPPPIPP